MANVEAAQKLRELADTTKQGYDVRAIANPLESLDRLHTHLQRLRQIAKRRPPRMQQTVSEHLAICAAIHDGDETAAAQATALHIINSSAQHSRRDDR